MDIILSIIIPVYNVEKYIFKTLDSIYSQEFPQNEVEVIVINDGTPDSSMEIVEQFYKKCNNLVVINQENQGLSGARNTGIHKAKGKYLWFVDSDDMIEDGILEKMISILHKGDSDVYSFKIREYNESGHVIKERFFLDEEKLEYSDGLEMIKRTARYHILHTPMQMHVIRTAFLQENNLYFKRGIYHEDMEFAPRMLLAAKNVCYVPWVAYKYIKRDSGSITTNPMLIEKRLKSLMQIAVEHIAIMNSLSGKERLLYSFSVYRVIAYLHSLIPQKEYGLWFQKLNISAHRREFNKIVMMNFNYDHKLTRFPRQLCYLFAPRFLKILGLGI